MYEKKERSSTLLFRKALHGIASDHVNFLFFNTVHDAKSHLTFFDVKKSWQKEDLSLGRWVT